MKFIDSNVFIYAADSKNPVKRSIARKLISVAVASGGYKINVQVLNEFSSTRSSTGSTTVRARPSRATTSGAWRATCPRRRRVRSSGSAPASTGSAGRLRRPTQTRGMSGRPAGGQFRNPLTPARLSPSIRAGGSSLDTTRSSS